MVLVLDGQQRLTSLLIGLRGSYTVRGKYRRRTSRDAWSRQRLYIDLLQDPAIEAIEDNDGDDVGVTYGLAFFEDEPRNDERHHWMKVGRVLDCTGDDSFDRLREEVLDGLPDSITRAQTRLAERTLDRLYRTIWKDNVIAYYTEKDQNYDRVLNIFIRANAGGVKLSKSDLLLSMITSKWGQVSARQEIYDLVDHLNAGLDARNDVDKDFVMKSCLVLSDLDHQYKIGNFTATNLSRIESNWPRIKSSLEATLRLVNRFGIDRDTLTSVNALLPIAYYLYRLERTLDGSTPFEIENAKRAHKWLLGSLLNGVFGGSSDRTIGAARTVLQQSLGATQDFPYDGLVRGLATRGRVTTFDENNIESVLDIEYGKRTCFLSLSLLYDTHNWGTSRYHIDHIVPRSLADRKALMAQNLPEVLIQRILDSVNRMGNLQILIGRENLEKSNTPFAAWIQTRDPEFLARHLIPSDQRLWDVTALPEFVRAREELIRRRLLSLQRGHGAPEPATPHIEGIAAGN